MTRTATSVNEIAIPVASPEDITGWFSGETVEAARDVAAKWAADEPNIARAVITDCRPAVGGNPPHELFHRWAITLAISWRQVEPRPGESQQDGLGL